MEEKEIEEIIKRIKWAAGVDDLSKAISIIEESFKKTTKILNEHR